MINYIYNKLINYIYIFFKINYIFTINTVPNTKKKNKKNE